MDTESESRESGGLLHTMTALTILALVSGVGYFWRQSVLMSPTSSSEDVSIVGTPLSASGTTTKIVSVLGDLTVFRTITTDTLTLVNANDIPSAVSRVTDLEREWDSAQSRLKSMNTAKWTEVDGAIDLVLRSLRAGSPDATSCKNALKSLLVVLE